MLYETEQDLAAEEQVKQRIEQKWHVSLHKLNINYRFDYSMKTENEGVIGFAEVKCRTCTKDAFPTFMMNLDKWMMAKTFATHLMRGNGKPVAAVLFVRWNDGQYGYYKITKDSQVQIDTGGRRDRGATDSEQPVVHIPIRDFTEF